MNTRSPPFFQDWPCQKWLNPTSYRVAAEAKLERCPPTLVCLLARTTIAIAFQRVYAWIRCSMARSPGNFTCFSTGMVLT